MSISWEIPRLRFFYTPCILEGSNGRRPRVRPVSQEICPPPWGPYFLGNMAPPSEIWPPRKHSLLYRYKLGNREAPSKTKMLKVFVSIYSSLHNLVVSKFFIAAKSKKFEEKRNNNVLVQPCQTHHTWVSVEDNVSA